MLTIVNFRSSRPAVFYKKGGIKNFANFTGKHLCQSLFFNKLQAEAACNFIKKENLTQMFPCEFCEISMKIFSYRTPPFAAFQNYIL